MSADREEMEKAPEAQNPTHPDQIGLDLTVEDMEKLTQPASEAISLLAGAAKAVQTSAADGMLKDLSNMMQAAQGPINDILKSILSAYKIMEAAFQSSEFKAFQEDIARLNKALEINRGAFERYVKLSEELQDLAPYMLEELQEERYNDFLGDKTIPELLDFINNGFDENGKPTGPIYQELIERAKEMKAQLEREETPDLSRQDKRDRAAALGAILTHKGTTAFPAKEDFLDVFHKTSIRKLSDEIRDSFDKKGQLNPLIANNANLPEIPESDPGLISYIFAEAMASYKPETQENNSVKIYLPKFFSDTQIDPRNYSQKRSDENTSMKELRYQKMLSLLAIFDQYIGVFHDGSAYRFMTFESYDPESETMAIYTPFLFELRRRIDPQRFTFLAHPAIASEPNKAAVEIVGRLLQGLQMRGTSTPDRSTYKAKPLRPKKRTTTKKEADGTTTTVTETFDTATQTQKKRPPLFTYHISYKRIIENCPQIRTALQDILKKGGPNAKALYNTKLKQTFGAAFRILEEETDAPIFYKGMTLRNKDNSGNYILPTKSRLTDEIIITHYGKNKDYTRP